MEMDHAAYVAKTKSMSDASLRHVIQDATAAMAIWPNGYKAGYYADEVNYCAMELKRRMDQQRGN